MVCPQRHQGPPLPSTLKASEILDMGNLVFFLLCGQLHMFVVHLCSPFCRCNNHPKLRSTRLLPHLRVMLIPFDRWRFALYLGMSLLADFQNGHLKPSIRGKSDCRQVSQQIRDYASTQSKYKEGDQGSKVGGTGWARPVGLVGSARAKALNKTNPPEAEIICWQLACAGFT